VCRWTSSEPAPKIIICANVPSGRGTWVRSTLRREALQTEIAILHRYSCKELHLPLVYVTLRDFVQGTTSPTAECDSRLYAFTREYSRASSPRPPFLSGAFGWKIESVHRLPLIPLMVPRSAHKTIITCTEDLATRAMVMTCSQKHILAQSIRAPVVPVPAPRAVADHAEQGASGADSSTVRIRAWRADGKSRAEASIYSSFHFRAYSSLAEPRLQRRVCWLPIALASDDHCGAPSRSISSARPEEERFLMCMPKHEDLPRPQVQSTCPIRENKRRMESSALASAR
jgi:hypothetical protein